MKTDIPMTAHVGFLLSEIQTTVIVLLYFVEWIFGCKSQLAFHANPENKLLPNAPPFSVHFAENPSP